MRFKHIFKSMRFKHIFKTNFIYLLIKILMLYNFADNLHKVDI